MTHNTGAKRDFTNCLIERATGESVPVVGRDFPSFLLENGVAGHVRATARQSNPIKLYVDEEVEFIQGGETGEVENVYLVLLDCHRPHQFSPSQDDFYPIPARILTNKSFVIQKPSDGHYLLTIDLDSYPAKRWRNDWSALFSPDQDRGSNPEDELSEASTDSGSQPTELQQIARRYLEGDQE